LDHEPQADPAALRRVRACGPPAPVAAARTPIPRPEGVNSRWSTDFVHDQLANGRRFRVLTIIDDVTRECLAAVPDTSLSGKRVVRKIDGLIARRGRPGAIVSDKGTEFTSSQAGEKTGAKAIRSAAACPLPIWQGVLPVAMTDRIHRPGSESAP
jgi:transposase InsO family protein